MLSFITRDWWVFALRGVAAILFGILAIAAPGITLTVLIYLFGAYAFVDAVVLLVALARGDSLARQHKWATAGMSLVGFIASLVTLFYPGITALSLLYVVAFWAIATGAMQVLSAVEFRKVIEGELWMMLGGILSIVFGILLVVSPGTGLLALVWLVGFWAIVFGASSLGLAYRLHGVDAALRKPASAH